MRPESLLETCLVRFVETVSCFSHLRDTV